MSARARSIFDTPAPVDRVARRVVFGEAEHWAPKRKPMLHHVHSEAPPAPLAAMPENAQDYAGLRRGRMTVLYYYAPSTKASPASWVVRCDCGRYETRRVSKWIRKPCDDDACVECRAAHFSKTGLSLGGKRSALDEIKRLKAKRAEVSA